MKTNRPRNIEKKNNLFSIPRQFRLKSSIGRQIRELQYRTPNFVYSFFLKL